MLVPIMQAQMLQREYKSAHFLLLKLLNTGHPDFYNLIEMRTQLTPAVLALSVL